MRFFIFTSVSGIGILHLFHNAFCFCLIFGVLNAEMSCMLPVSTVFQIFDFVICQYNQCLAKVSNFIF